MAWGDLREWELRTNAYVQRLTGDGQIAPGWPLGGTITGPEASRYTIAPDGDGGLLIAWDTFPGRDIFLQRLTGAGTVRPGWPAAGVLVCGEPHHQGLGGIVSDDAGGAFVVWEDWRAGDYEKDIFASHITGDGILAPGWPVDGLPICAAPYDQLLPGAAPDGEGGIYATWFDGRSVPWNLYVVRIRGDGTVAPGWEANGTFIREHSGARYVFPFELVPDGVGGVYVPWGEGELNDSFYDDLYLLRLTADGVIHPGWPTRGVPVCTAIDAQQGMRVASDAHGGIVLVWNDYRAYSGPSPSTAADAYALRIMPDGSRAPGWPEDGLVVNGGTGFQYAETIAPDGGGGTYVAVERSGTPTRIFIHHLTEAGAVAPGWPLQGVPVVPGYPARSQQFPRMAVDGQGGVFAVWEDHRRIGFQDIYAQRYFAGGPTPTLLALVRFEAHPDRVVLTWHGSGDGATRATIYRRTDAVGWLPLGEASFDASGTLRYEDRSVTPGGRYAYRLGVRESGSETFSDETWVDVPAALELALEGLRPNPAVDRLRVALTLPRAGRATLELLDVTGRTVLEREVGTLGPGRHLVALGEGRKVAPGVYWLRLTADQRMLVVRAVVMR